MYEWADAFDEIGTIVEDARKIPEGLTIDQRIAIAQARVMLVVAQKLGDLKPEDPSTD
jgi:hypothetical protein